MLTIVSRWREYFSDLLNCPATAREEALASVDQYPVHAGRHGKSINIRRNLSCHQINRIGENTRIDGIPAKIYKYEGTAFHAQLLKFYCICWTAKELSQQFKEALIIYKKKVDRRVYGNCRGILLLSTAGENCGRNPSENTTDHYRGDLQKANVDFV